MAELLKGVIVSNPNGKNISQAGIMEKFTKKVETGLLDEKYSVHFFSLSDDYNCMIAILIKKTIGVEDAKM